MLPRDVDALNSSNHDHNQILDQQTSQCVTRAQQQYKQQQQKQERTAIAKQGVSFNPTSQKQFPIARMHGMQDIDIQVRQQQQQQQQKLQAFTTTISDLNLVEFKYIAVWFTMYCFISFVVYVGVFFVCEL